MRQQPTQHTVGDTLTLVQRIRVAPNVVVQPRVIADSNLVTLLSPPSLTREGENVRIAYHVAFWQAGSSDLVLPGPVTVSAGGAVDTLPDQHIPLLIASVLPTGKAANTVAPKGARPVLPRGDRSFIPFTVLLGGLLVLLGVAWWWRRRRGPERVPPRPPVVAAADLEMLNRWLDAGEAQLALTHVEARLRHRPGLESWHERAATARFARGANDELAALVREGWEHLS